MTIAPQPAQSTPSRSEPVPGIGAMIAVSSAKGGVGKSTVTVNLAAALQKLGKAVGILDADILGPSIPGMLGIDAAAPSRSGGRITPSEAFGIKVVSMAMFSGEDQPIMLRGPLVGKYLNLFLAGVDWGKLDILLIDMPPGTGDVQLNIAQTFPLSGAVIVTTPQAVSTRIARRGAQMFHAVRTPILGVVENMRTFTCPSCGTNHDLFGHGGGERLAAELGIPFLGALPLDPAILAAGDDGVPLALRESAEPSSDSYAALARAIDASLITDGAGLPPFRLDWASGDGSPGWNEGRTRADGDPAVPVGLRKSDARTLSILWQDGRRQDVDVRALRLVCGCALCRDEMTGRPILNPKTVPADVQPVAIGSIGRYALGLSWTDGHNSGIHPFEAIRALPDADRCPVEEPASDPDIFPQAARSRSEVLAAAQRLLDGGFNAQVARHGGHVRLVDFAEGRLTVEMEGRCQGCAASQLTLRRGLAAALRAGVPEVTEIVDATDHQRGPDPYFPQ